MIYLVDWHLPCPSGAPGAVIDGVDVYIDQLHLTPTFSAAMAPVMSNELKAAEVSLGLEPVAVPGSAGH